jgi:ribosome-associated protein
MRKDPKPRRTSNARSPRSVGGRRGTSAQKKKRGTVRKEGGTKRRGARKQPLAAPPPPPPVENAAARALARKIAQLVLDKKAGDVVILDVRGIASYADYVVIASGESDRQVTAMAEHLQIKLKEEGLRVIGAEGADTGQWVLLDFGDVVAHLFFTEARSHYDLEGLWADAPREAVS